MAQNTDVTVAASSWTQLTDADASGPVTFQNKTGDVIWIKATVNTTAPTNFLGSIRYEPNEGEKKSTLAELFPGLTSPVRLWAWSQSGGRVVISHA